MIVVVAPYVYPQHSDGYLQRVYAMDSAFAGMDRIYVQFSPDSSHWGLRRLPFDEGRCQVLTLHKEIGSHSKLLAMLLAEAETIYVHSIFRIPEISDLMPETHWHRKVVLDIHGVVPEECLMEGTPDRASRFSAIEEFAFRNCRRFVSVSEAMIAHFQKKYAVEREKFILAPITPAFASAKLADGKTWSRTRSIDAIYAGGTQRWQRIDLMADAILRSDPEKRFVILTPRAEEMRQMLGPEQSNVCIDTVSPAQVQEYLEQANFGFLLRDDSVVNSVSCPTKLVEYLWAGVIPVVLSAQVGDFERRSVRWVPLDDFVSGNYTQAQIDSFRMSNRKVAEELLRESKRAIALIREISMGSGSGVSSSLTHEFDRMRIYDSLRDAHERIHIFRNSWAFAIGNGVLFLPRTLHRIGRALARAL